MWTVGRDQPAVPGLVVQVVSEHRRKKKRKEKFTGAACGRLLKVVSNVNGSMHAVIELASL
jgi:hypothetical protein